jgi:PD-(D/E)XK nuclease superfamily
VILERDGVALSTQSLINTFRRCPQKVSYSHVEGIKRRYITSDEHPLERGNWLHVLLERHYKGEDWKVMHGRLTKGFDQLSDHEKEELGDLPAECETLMKGYLWHWGADRKDPLHGWKIHEVEFKVETTFPNGDIFQGKCDLLVEDDLGLWIVDHKTKNRLPDFSMRLKDIQSVGYVKAAREMGIPVSGFIWNYLWTKPPTKPALLKNGSRLSARACVTDYPTLWRAIKEYGLDVEDYRDWLLELKGQRYSPGKVQLSPFFRRHVLERDDASIERVWKSMYRTHKRLHTYYDAANGDPDYVERVVDISCAWMCQYRALCDAEIFGGNADIIRSQQFIQADPMSYYQDNKKQED